MLVHLDDADSCRSRTALAAGLARAHGAHLTGLYRAPGIDARLYADPAMGVENLEPMTAGEQLLWPLLRSTAGRQ